MFATIEGINSARAINRLIQEHDAYRWLCGGVPLNYHTIADFQSKNAAHLDELLTRSIQQLSQKDALVRSVVAQDGVRVRASAGAASFRRRATLETRQQQLDEEPEPVGATPRKTAARVRALRERKKRTEAALEKMPEAEARKSKADKEQARVSTTDAEASVMKMADGGYRPAYNAQFVTAVSSQLILGVSLSSRSSDMGELGRMAADLHRRYGASPQAWLVDGGFVKHEDITALTEQGVTVYAPVPASRTAGDPHTPRPTDNDAIQAWRKRMATDAAKAIYRFRAATAEWVNAQARNHGLTLLRLRGANRAERWAQPCPSQASLRPCYLGNVTCPDRSLPARSRSRPPTPQHSLHADPR